MLAAHIDAVREYGCSDVTQLAVHPRTQVELKSALGLRDCGHPQIEHDPPKRTWAIECRGINIVCDPSCEPGKVHLKVIGRYGAN